MPKGMVTPLAIAAIAGAFVYASEGSAWGGVVAMCGVFAITATDSLKHGSTIAVKIIIAVERVWISLDRSRRDILLAREVTAREEIRQNGYGDREDRRVEQRRFRVVSGLETRALTVERRAIEALPAMNLPHELTHTSDDEQIYTDYAEL